MPKFTDIGEMPSIDLAAEMMRFIPKIYALVYLHYYSIPQLFQTIDSTASDPKLFLANHYRSLATISPKVHKLLTKVCVKGSTSAEHSQKL